MLVMCDPQEEESAKSKHWYELNPVLRQRFYLFSNKTRSHNRIDARGSLAEGCFVSVLRYDPGLIHKVSMVDQLMGNGTFENIVVF